MIVLTCEEIVKVVNGKLLHGEANTVFKNISTDSRKIHQGDLFIPIVGEKFDGHEFILSSIEAGAFGSLTDRELPIKKGVLIKVEDTLKALRDLATYYRSKFNIPVVAITGSVGKTSTKDMVTSVLETSFNVLKTQGNFNNEIGLPLTVFNLEENHQAAVLEMGMSGFGEISRLTSIAKPKVAVITNIGLSHIEKLGSRQNILKAKMEVLEGLASDGLLVLNGDDSLLSGLKGLLKVRTAFYGIEDGDDYLAYNINSQGENGTYFEIMIKNKEYKVYVPVPGVHNVYNALASIAVGIELRIPINQIISGIAAYTPGKMRMNISSVNGVKVINDTYNASPQSMEAAINVLKDIANNNRTIAILGDMLELGEFSGKAHYDVGKYAAQKGIDYVIAVGENGNNIISGALEAGTSKAKLHYFENNLQATTFLKDFIKQDDVVLVKGSRGMKMEEIVNVLTIGF